MIDKPNIDRIPASLRQLAWQPMDPEREWSDGQVLLVAVPVRTGGVGNQWRYEFAVVNVKCDEDYFSVTEADEPWVWDLDDVDYYVEVSR